MQADHNRQMAEVERKHRREIADKEAKHKQEISFLKTIIARAAAWFPYCRVQRRADGNTRQGKAVGVCRGTLLGGTRTEIQDRKGRGSSDERPHGRDEISSCHRPKAHCRMVQGAIRQAKAEHTPPHTAAKKRQGNEAITVLSCWKIIKKVLFIISLMNGTFRTFAY